MNLGSENILKKSQFSHTTMRYGVLSGSTIFLGLLSIHFGQDMNWDMRNYHYYNVYALLHDRVGFDYASAQVQPYLSPLADAPFYFLVTYLLPVVEGFILGALHGTF